MNFLIIEDEYNAFEYLHKSIKKIRPDAILLEHLESVEDAVNWLHQNETPQLIFLDIQLSDGLSFEIFKHVKINCPIIFTTAFDQYAIDAFKVNSIDYLLKPIDGKDLQRALDKFDQIQNPTQQVDVSQQLLSVFNKLSPKKKQRCLVKKGNHFEFINIADIAFIDSNDGLTFLHTFQGKRHLYTNTIEGLSLMLDNQSFFQINRGQIVNVDAIKKIHPYFNSRMKIELLKPVEGVELVVSRSKMNNFKEWLDA